MYSDLDEIVATFFLFRCSLHIQITTVFSNHWFRFKRFKKQSFVLLVFLLWKPRQALPAASCTGSALGSTLGCSKLLVAPQPMAAHDLKRRLGIPCDVKDCC